MSVAEHLEIRRRIAEGQTFAVAAAAVGCSTKSIQRVLIRCGGLPPPARARPVLRLSCSEREELSRGLRAGDSLRAVASRLGRAPSTISREVIANGSRQRYRAWRAERTAMGRARRPKLAKLASHTRLRREVERRVGKRWSPQQIAARLVRDYPNPNTVHLGDRIRTETWTIRARR